MKKRLLSLFLAAALCLVPVNVSAGDVLYGDANNDGSINMKDVLTERRFLADLSTKISMTLGDCNGDGAVNMKDVLILRQYLAEIIDHIDGKLPVATDKRLRSIHYYDEDGVNFEIGFYTYNKAGQMTLETDRLPDGTLLWKREYSYDKSGRQVGCVYTPEDGAIIKTATTYDDKGNVLTISKTNSAGTLLTKTTYQYSEDGKRTTELWTDSAGKSEGKAVYSYNGSGQLVKEETFDASGTSIGTVKYSYNADGTTAGVSRYGYDGALVSEEIFAHDAAGNITSHVINDDRGLLDARVSYVYDISTKLKWEFAYNFSTGNERWKYVYAQNHPIKNATCVSWDGKTVLWKATYQYVDA